MIELDEILTATCMNVAVFMDTATCSDLRRDGGGSKVLRNVCQYLPAWYPRIQ